MRDRSFTVRYDFDDVEVRNEMSETNEQLIVDFFNDLHIDLNVAIERRKNFDAAIDRETISAQDIDFLDVAIDVKSDDTLSESSRTTSDVEIERDKSFDDVSDEKIIDRDDETEEVDDIDFEICVESETTDFDFLTCRVRICS